MVVSSVDDLIGVDKYPRAFRTINTNQQWIDASLDYLLNVLKRRKIAIIGDTSAYAVASIKMINAKLAAVGVELVSSVLVDPQQDRSHGRDHQARAKRVRTSFSPGPAPSGCMPVSSTPRGNTGWDVPVVAQVGILAYPVKTLVTNRRISITCLRRDVGSSNM